MDKEKTCKNCKFWDMGTCENNAVSDMVKIKVDDDSGLWFEIHTKPDFSCSNFKAEQEN